MKSGAQQQHRPGGVEVVEDLRIPRAAGLVRRIAVVGREVAQRQHGGVDAVAAAAGGLEVEAALDRLQADRGVGDDEQVARAAQSVDGVAQEALDVLAIDAAPHEDAGAGADARGLALGRRQLVEPAQEVVGLILEGAHPRGADVEQVLRVGGGVGEALAEPAALLDEIDPLAGSAVPEQMDGGESTAEACADDGDPAGAVGGGAVGCRCGPGIDGAWCARRLPHGGSSR